MAVKVKRGKKAKPSASSKSKTKASKPKNTRPASKKTSKVKSSKRKVTKPSSTKASKAKSSKTAKPSKTKKSAPSSNGTGGRGVVKLNTDLLVGLTEISDRAEVSRSAVGNWVNRYEDFPETVVNLASGPVFYWPEVKKWLKETKRL